MVGRKRLIDVAADLVATNIRGEQAAPGQLEVHEDAASLEPADIVLVAVKSMDTPAAVEALRGVVRPETLVVSLQNGLRNVPVLSALDADVVPGMVTFNVVWEGARLEQATSGPLLIGRAQKRTDLAAFFVERVRAAGEKAAVRDDIEAVQLGKLLLNLNNGICAVSGVPIAASIRSRTLRRAYAVCIREGLAVAARAGRPVASIGVLSPWLISRMLPLPDAVVFKLASKMISIDPRARSSTLQDLDRGRPTEIDFLNGEIVHMAGEAGGDAPANRWVTETVHALEQMQADLQFATPEEVYAGVTAAL